MQVQMRLLFGANLIDFHKHQRVRFIVMQWKTLVIILLLIPSSLAAQPEIHVGMKAPDFRLPYATRDTINFSGIQLSDYIKKSIVVLAFYPADWSEGCTQEVCTLRDNFSQLSTLEAEVLGISGDYVFSHYEWARHHNLPFKLLSDHNHSVAKLYNSYNESSGFNKRTIVVIDTNGVIGYADMHYDVSSMESFLKLCDAIGKIK